MGLLTAFALAALVASTVEAAPRSRKVQNERQPHPGQAGQEQQQVPFQIKNFDQLGEVDEEKWLMHANGDAVEYLLANEPRTLVLLLLEDESRCGEPCAMIRKLAAAVSEKLAGSVAMGYLNGHDTLSKFGEEDTAFATFNLTGIPAIKIFGAGAKRWDTGMTLDPQIAMQMLATGAKPFFEFLKGFTASTVQSVKFGSAPAFMTAKRPQLPRVLLVATKPDISATYKSLSSLFSSRAIFGQAVVADANLLGALGIDEDSAPVLLVSSAGGLPAVELVELPSPEDEDKDADSDKKKSKKGKKKKAAVTGLAPGSMSTSAFGWKLYDSSNGGFTFAELRAFLDTALPEAPVPQLRSQEDFTKYCGHSDISVCFVAVLPSGARERAAFLSTEDGAFARVTSYTTMLDLPTPEETTESAALSAVVRAASYPHLAIDYTTLPMGPSANRDLLANRIPVAFAWVDAEYQGAWASVFKVQAPGLVAINPRKKAYAAFRGTFDAAHVSDFVRAMMSEGLPAGATTLSADATKSEEGDAAVYDARRLELVKMEQLPSGVPELQQQPEEEAAKPKKAKKKSGGGKKKAKGGKKDKKKAEEDDEDKDEL